MNGPWHRQRQEVFIPMKMVVGLDLDADEVLAHLDGPGGVSCAVTVTVPTLSTKYVIVETPLPIRGTLTLTHRRVYQPAM